MILASLPPGRTSRERMSFEKVLFSAGFNQPTNINVFSVEELVLVIVTWMEHQSIWWGNWLTNEDLRAHSPAVRFGSANNTEARLWCPGEPTGGTVICSVELRSLCRQEWFPFAENCLAYCVFCRNYCKVYFCWTSIMSCACVRALCHYINGWRLTWFSFRGNLWWGYF